MQIAQNIFIEIAAFGHTGFLIGLSDKRLNEEVEGEIFMHETHFRPHEQNSLITL